MLPSDPMTYLDYLGERTFQDELAPCGEYEDRKCGVNGTTCRQRQNSVQLLRQRLGSRGNGTGADGTAPRRDPAPGFAGGCAAGRGGAGAAMALAMLGAARRRRRR